ncbi:MAG: hypothetical protein AB7T63_12075 [Planctomycetota bacterium]
MSHARKPAVQALLVCDQVYQDTQTNKMVVAGTFTQIFASEFPAVHAQWCVYVRLVDFKGPASLRLRVVDLDDDSVVGSLGPVKFEMKDRLVGAEVAIKMPPLPIPHAGAYALDVLWGDEDVPLSSWRFVAQPPPGKKKSHG